MFSRDCSFSIADSDDDRSNREAIDGFSAIVAGLDRGLDDPAMNFGVIADAMAIGLGWLVLAAIIFYPALQLAAIAIGAAFMCMRSFLRYAFGSVDASLMRLPLRSNQPSFMAP
jgi:hypothetical protein